jgi:uncharacterized OsmC-like protein
MNAEELRARQGPVKERYREDPASALVTMRVRGTRTGPTSFRVGSVGAGLHPAAGGDGTEACSGDMLLEALVACAGVTLATVATAMGLALEEAHVEAEGDLDFRGTLGVAKEVPVGFKEIRLRYRLKTDAPEDKVSNLVRLTERYCVVLQTLRHGPDVKVEVLRD